MKYITYRYKKIKIINIKFALFAIFIFLLFFPSMTLFEYGGDNYYTIHINGKPVGASATPEEAERMLREARRRIAAGSEELILLDSEMTTEGQEVLWGKVDDEEQVISRMIEVLGGSIRETRHRSYTVRIDEYTVNLSSKEEVLQLLQAAIGQYDKAGKYKVELSLDAERELSVLTAQVLTAEETEATETAEAVSTSAGIDYVISDLFASVEPAVEKELEEYNRGLISIQYGDTVEVVEAYLLPDKLTDVDVAIEEITREQEKNEVYEVVAGDTLSGISLKTNLPMERLLEMNEHLEDENSLIRIGEELIITVPEPEVTIERQEERYYEEDYEEAVQYVDNDEWYTTEMQILQEPSAGHRRAVALISYRNDKEVAREIVKEDITFQAIPKIVERGTIVPPIYIKPLSGGRLSSGFGGRNAPTRGASSNHKGIDWATPVGTAVVASSGGTVVRAGWGSGYGYVVYIRHSDGRETRYAHLSKVLVSVGETVSQGQRIALSGNTGVSTGPHVHFEILINGSQVNPLKYLN